MTLAELKRDAASGKMQMEMTERYGKTPEERFKGFRPIIKVNTVAITFRNADGKPSDLHIPHAKLVEYAQDKTTLTVYAIGTRPMNDAEKAKFAAWDKFVSLPENENRDTYWLQKDFFKGEFEYLFTEKNGKRVLIQDNERIVVDPAVRGEPILKYRVWFIA